MISKKIVAPSILSADFANLEKEIKSVAKAGAGWIHVDVMDGHFVPNLTIGLPVVASLKKVSPLPLDVHLMIEKPERYIEGFIKAGADLLTIHVEATNEVEATLKKIRALGAKPGLTLRPGTSLSNLEKYLHLVDLVLVMTVEPGFGGQAFQNQQIIKINELYEIRKSKNFKYLIEVDGGINDQTAALCHKADVFVAGSYVFSGDYQERISKLQLSNEGQ